MPAGPVARGLLVVAVLAGPPISIVAISRSEPRGDPSLVHGEREPVVGVAALQDVVEDVNVLATAEYVGGRTLIAPAWTGTVTAVHVDVGVQITVGQAVASVDGVHRVAYGGQGPLYRPLARGVQGADVVTLHELLVASGELAAMPARSDVFTATTEAAVVRFGRRIGVSAEEASLGFQPAWGLWLPAPDFVPESIDLTVAAPAPPAGAVVAAAPDRVVGLALLSANGEPFDRDLAGVWQLQFGTQLIELDDGTPAPESLVALENLTDPDDDPIPAVLRRPSSERLVVIPASAVVTASSYLCVWRSSAAGDGFEAVPVTLGQSVGSGVVVTDGIAEGDQVALNPGELPDLQTCPST